MTAGIEFDEVVEALKRSNAPTLIVEGRDDYVAFSEFEIENIHWGFTILPVKGQGNVERLIGMVQDIGHPALAFLLDRDCTVFFHIPRGFDRNDTFFTDGYAIENDLLRDGNVIKLLKTPEKGVFAAELDEVAMFFACAASRHVAGEPQFPLSLHPRQLMWETSQLLPGYAAFVQNEIGKIDETYKRAITEPFKYVKGKSILGLLTRHLSKADRQSKFSRANLLDLGSSARGILLRKIEDNVLLYFRSIGIAPEV